MADRTVVIWGAGNIGRGYVADMFHAAGYRLVLVGRSQETIAALQAAGRYTVVKIGTVGQRRDQIISRYTALTASQTDLIAATVAAADMLAVTVYHRDFPELARQLVPGLVRRSKERPEATLDILVCANIPLAAGRFGTLLQEALPPELDAYFADRIGVVGTTTMRLAVQPPPDVPETAPLWVWTDGHEEFPVERRAFKGEIPRLPGLRLVEDMRVEEIRKLYTYNLHHASLAYLGALRGHAVNMDCVADPWVMDGAEAALHEASQALQAEYGFSDSETAQWTGQVLARNTRPVVSDAVARIAADPARKLAREDRLVGPAILARRHGIAARHLARVIASALLFRQRADPGAVYVQARIEATGLRAAIADICGLTTADTDLSGMILEAYRDFAGSSGQAARFSCVSSPRAPGRQGE